MANSIRIHPRRAKPGRPTVCAIDVYIQPLHSVFVRERGGVQLNELIEFASRVGLGNRGHRERIAPIRCQVEIKPDAFDG